MESIILSSIPIEISDFPNHKEATFLISVLDEYNHNGVLIQEEEGEKYHSTIIGYPILAHLKYDKDGKPDDFGGHELRAKYNQETKKIEYYFATHPIGSVIESWIEEREIAGYEGKKKAVLIKAKLWKSRFTEYFKVFDKLWDDGNISSSWEISTSKVEKTSKGKILKAFEFIGNCLLGSSVKGAVDGAGVLEVASSDDFNYELSYAFLNDIKALDGENILTLSDTTYDEKDKDGINNNDLSITGGGNELEDNTKQTSALTENDVYRKVRKAINNNSTDKYYYISIIYPYEFKAYAYDWSRDKDSDYVEFTYSVNSDDTISITSQRDVEMVFQPKAVIDSQVSELQTKFDEAEKQIAEAGKLLTEATKDKETLEAQVTELTPFKEKVEQMEQAEKERELAEKKEELQSLALEDNLIASEELESDEKLASIFAELTLENFETSQEKVEVIKGRRAIEKFKASKTDDDAEDINFEISTKKETPKAKTNLNDGSGDAMLSAFDIVKGMLNRK